MLPLWYIYFGYKEYLKPLIEKIWKKSAVGSTSTPKIEPAKAKEPPPRPEPPKPSEPTKPKEEPPKPAAPPRPEPPKPFQVPKPIEPPKPAQPKAPEPPKLPEQPRPVPPKAPEPPAPPARAPEPSLRPEQPRPKPEPPKKLEPFRPEPPKPSTPSNANDSPGAAPWRTQRSPQVPGQSFEPNVIEGPDIPAWRAGVPEPPKRFPPGGPASLNRPPSPYSEDDIISGIEEDDLIEEEEEEEEEEERPRRNKTRMVDAAVLDKLEAGFKKLEASDSKSLLKKYLTRDVFDRLKNLKTPSFGSTLLDVIQSGVENLDSGVGIYAPDAEAYTVFADLFDPIIEDYHTGFKKTDAHPAKDWGDVDSFGNLDPAGEFIISTRVRCGRSMEGYPFNPCLTEAQYKEMEEKVSSTLSGMSGELKGTYYPLTGMTKETQQQLIDDHFLFKEGDRFLQAANACRFWPTGRGIYHNDNKTFLVWCNEEDHLRLISMQMGGDLGQVYRRLVSAVNEIEKRVPFSHHDRLGFLTFCPTNLGTTVRASVHIKVPKLAASREKLEEVASRYNLQVRGTRGEHTEAEGGVYDISNKRRMGLTEFQAVKEMYEGIAEIIKIEKEL